MDKTNNTGFEIVTKCQGDWNSVFRNWVFYLCLIFVLGSGYQRYTNRYFERPLEEDERITLQEYTWAGIQADGNRNELRTHQQIASVTGLSLRRFLLGCWVSVGRWTEPNNHIVHSLMVNPSLLLTRNSLRAIRIPALLSAIAFSVCCAAWCIKSGWILSAPLATIISFYHPYIVKYSQTSRGYCLMLFLCLLTLMLSYTMVKSTPKKVLWIAATTMTASMIALFLTIVSMIVDWIVPISIAMGVDILKNQKLNKEARAMHLSRLVTPFLFVGYTVFLFACDRLPQLVSSAAQYGVPFQGWKGFLNVLSNFSNYLAPTTGWSILFAMGLFGLFLMMRSDRNRLTSWIFIAVSVVSLCHFVATRKFPYERNMGYLLIPVIFGFAQTFSSLFQWTRSSLDRICLYVCGGVLVLFSIGPSGWTKEDNSTYTEMRALLRNGEVSSGDLILVGRGATELSLFLNWQENKNPEQKRLWILQLRKFASLFQGPDQGVVDRVTGELLGEPTFRNASFDCWMKEIKEVPDAQSTKGPKIAVWSIPMEIVTVSPDPILKQLRQSNLIFFGVNKRYQAKMSIYSRLDQVVVLIPSSELNENNSTDMDSRIKDLFLKNGGTLKYYSLQTQYQ